MTNIIIEAISRSTLRLFTYIITESSIATEELEIRPEELEIRPLTVFELKKLWILREKTIHFDGWTYFLYKKNHIYIDNLSCYRYLDDIFTPMFQYIMYENDPDKFRELRNLQQFIKITYPFDIISTRELTDISQIEKELVKYCQIYAPKVDLPLPIEIEKTNTQSIIDIIDDFLLISLRNVINSLGSIIIEQDPSQEDLILLATKGIGYANYTILLIDILKTEGYPIKDYILEGRELITNLNTAVEIKLDNRFGLIKDDRDLYKIDMMKKFIEETFPLNKIVSEDIDPRYTPIYTLNILKDFLRGIKIIPKPEMFRQIIRYIDLEPFKLLIEKVLKENRKAKIYMYLTREDIESILESDQFIPRLHVKDADKYIVYTTGFNVSITDNFDILSILSGNMPPKRNIATTKRILLDADIEIYKNILIDIIVSNPHTIIGDIIFHNVENLKNILDILPTDIGIQYNFRLDILQKDQDIISQLYKTVDTTKFKEGEGEPILKAFIDRIEISKTLYEEDYLLGYERSQISDEILYDPNHKKFRLLTFHIYKINKIDS